MLKEILEKLNYKMKDYTVKEYNILNDDDKVEAVLILTENNRKAGDILDKWISDVIINSERYVPDNTTGDYIDSISESEWLDIGKLLIKAKIIK